MTGVKKSGVDGTRRRTCQACRSVFTLVRDEQNIRCPECRERSRHKSCRKCGTAYRDDSDKNTRRYCVGCQAGPSVPSPIGVSDRLHTRRRNRVRQGAGGRLDDFRTLKVGTATWWGRVGEILYLHTYPSASDVVGDYGNKTPFDVHHPELGRINVKIAGQHTSTQGHPSWKFQFGTGLSSCDHAYLIGLDAERRRVVRAWSMPASKLPRTVKVVTPASKEYVPGYEAPPEDVLLLDRKLQAILSLPPVSDQAPEPALDYNRIVLGRIGEAIYQRLHPSSRHESAVNPLATYDFEDDDGSFVNVRVRRSATRDSGPDRWTFFRTKGCTADTYYFIGVDRSATQVQSMYRIPSADMPAHGVSVSVRGSPKWDRYRVPMNLPAAVSSFVEVSDMEATHVEIGGLTRESVSAMTDAERDSLVGRAFAYHRAVGFSYPSLPTDTQVQQDLAGLVRCRADGKVIPVNPVGLGLCSAYMPHRFDARNSDADFSAVGAFHDDARLRRTLHFCLRGARPGLTGSHLRSALTALNRTPGGFRPAVARVLVDALCPEGGTVFDPCAGWGGRLLGTVSSGRRYIGVEPSDLTRTALCRLGLRVCGAVGVGIQHVRIIHATVQDADLTGVHADFAMTSPPFWTKEVYDGGTRDDASVDDWREDFLRPMFRRVSDVLKPGSRFVVHIADIRERGVTVPLARIVSEDGMGSGFILEDEWRMHKSSFGKQLSGRTDPLFVFRRG